MPENPRALKIDVADEIKIKELRKRKFKDPARRKKDRIRSEQTVGDDYYRDLGTWSKRNMIVDRDNNKYFEEIIDSTGKVIRRIEEPLDQHQGHGSAKHRSAKRKRK